MWRFGRQQLSMSIVDGGSMLCERPAPGHLGAVGTQLPERRIWLLRDSFDCLPDAGAGIATLYFAPIWWGAMKQPRWWHQ